MVNSSFIIFYFSNESFSPFDPNVWNVGITELLTYFLWLKLLKILSKFYYLGLSFEKVIPLLKA